jgi:hypothetical protein
LGRRGRGCGTVIVFLSSCGSADAHASGRERFRRSENLRISALSAIEIPLFLPYAQVSGLLSYMKLVVRDRIELSTFR